MKKISTEQRKERIILEGRIAREQRKSIEDNPYISCGRKYIVYAGYWEKGYNEKR